MHVVRGKKIEVLFSPEEIAARHEELAREIASGPSQDLLVIA
ncbi:MAG: hypoxanthine phosphoribosyltransferase, partial [Martelella sp.]